LHDQTNLLGGGDAYEYTNTKTDVDSVLTESNVLCNDRPVMIYGLGTACSKGFVCDRMLGSIFIRDGCWSVVCLEHEHQTKKHDGIHQSLCFSLQSKVQVFFWEVAQPRSTVSTCRVPRDQGRPWKTPTMRLHLCAGPGGCGESYSSAIMLQLLTSFQCYSNGENRTD